MGKKIMILCGSPNAHGNTNTIVDWIVEGAAAEGADIERIDATKLKAKGNGCTACMGCQKSEKFECVIEDEISPIIARIPAADVAVFATPIYFSGPTAQLKIVLDRTFSLFKIDPETEKVGHAFDQTVLALVATAGGPETDVLEKTFSVAMEVADRTLEKFLVPNAPFVSGQISEKAEVRESAIAFGKKIGAA